MVGNSSGWLLRIFSQSNFSYKETLALVLVKKERSEEHVTSPIASTPPTNPWGPSRLFSQSCAFGMVRQDTCRSESSIIKRYAVVKSLSKGNIENINGGDLHILRAEGPKVLGHRLKVTLSIECLKYLFAFRQKGKIRPGKGQ